MKSYGYSEVHVFAPILILIFRRISVILFFKQEFFHFSNKVCVYFCYLHIVSKN